MVSARRPLLIAYRDDWPQRAADLISLLQSPFGDLAARFEHIGSTSIPGMAAKDVIDLQASVLDLALAADALDDPLAALGFERSPYEADHIPAGRTDEPGNWAKRLWLRRNHCAGDANLQVRRAGAPNERLALLFRDWFRAHPEAIPAYSAFKMGLAEVVPDFDSYSDIKDPVVDLVITVAEEWAASVHWRL